MTRTRYQIEINPNIPLPLIRLEELAHNLWYSWDRPTRALFARLGAKQWENAGHSPKATLRRADQNNLKEAAADTAYMAALNRALVAFDAYLNAKPSQIAERLNKGDLIAYFCAEFGFHESLPIYSGGLGILAGDHCKTAADLKLPFIGVGLLYRQGYFQQFIDAHGRQFAEYNVADLDNLPVSPVYQNDGGELIITIPMPGREVRAKVWKIAVGRVAIYLLDTAIDGNNAHDYDITHRLYGGDRAARLEQEFLLGVGGVLALQAMEIVPTVWHINEGHAAFLVLERIRLLVTDGLDFAAALEAVAANTVFTTHTVVPAGHDHFSAEMIQSYFQKWCHAVGVMPEVLLELGRTPTSPDFNMTALAIRCSRHQNGVSRIHGEVSAKFCQYLWPQLEPEDNPIGYVTNGVHVPTFLSDLWQEVFERNLSLDWRQHLTDADSWAGVCHISDHLFWSVRQSIKEQMLHLLRSRISEQHRRNKGSQAHLDRILRFINPDNPNVLTIGFGRRFATYKRATLLFHDLEWLKEIVCNPERPVVFIFAGKAHPADEPGQAIIQRIAKVAAMPDFIGRILLVEGYDLHIARRLVSGVDVWLNNPVYPLEASGTSGMKAAINGAINLSVQDGWWDEASINTIGKENGWSIKPVSTMDEISDEQRDTEESCSLYEILQDKVVPLYYERGANGFSPGWVAMAKRSIATIAPKFNSERVLAEYVSDYYEPAARQWHNLRANNFQGAKDLSQWKIRVRAVWHKVSMERIDIPTKRLAYGAEVQIQVAVNMSNLLPEDIVVELLFSRPNYSLEARSPVRHIFRYVGQLEDGRGNFLLEIVPEVCGKMEYAIRVYPSHPYLTHPFEMGMMLWL